MTVHRTLAVSIAALAVLTSACTGGSDAVETPGAPSTRLEGEQPTTLPPPTTTATTVPAPTTVAPTTAPPTTAAPVVTEAAEPTTTAPVETTPPTVDPNDFLRQGDEGSRVGLVQFKLVVLGYLPTGADTGVFDSATNSAVLKFQGDYGLIVDGIVGPETERAITAAAESINPEP